GTVCVVGKIRDLILQLSKSSIYSTKPQKGFTLAFPFSVSYQDFLISASSMPGVALPSPAHHALTCKRTI
ncbi:hypothetical protein ABEL13_28550, partial [Klebsiella pneumoniae]|nr:hypothetical protein [Klebsiella pneumoniae]